MADAVLDPTKLSPEARLAMMAEAYSDVWAQVMSLGGLLGTRRRGDEQARREQRDGSGAEDG